MATLLHITLYTKNGVKPVQSGIRATQNGYTKIPSAYTLHGTWKNFKDLYTGIFLPSKNAIQIIEIAGIQEFKDEYANFQPELHMTWIFSPQNPQFPYGVEDNMVDKLKVVGFYKDDDIGALIVQWKDIKTQPEIKR